MKKYQLIFLFVVLSTKAFCQIIHNPNYTAYLDGPPLQLNSGWSPCNPSCTPRPGGCTAYRYYSSVFYIEDNALFCDTEGSYTVEEQRVLKSAGYVGATCKVTETVNVEGRFTVNVVRFAWTSTPPASCVSGTSLILASYFSYNTGTVFSGPGVSGGRFYPNIAGPGNHVLTASSGAFSNGDVSRTVTVRVYPALQITTQPASKTVCMVASTFSVLATTNNPPLSYQWQSSPNGTTFTDISNGGVYAGSTTPVLELNNATSALEGYRYRVVIQDACGSAGKVTSTAATVSFNQNVSFTQHPANQVVCEGAQAAFTAAATGTGVTYQWQASNAGASWSNVVDGLTYTGTQTATLKAITNASMNNLWYRVIATGTCNTYIGNTASLNITTGPSITTSPVPVTVCEGSSATFSVSATGTTPTYQWQYSSSGGVGTFTDLPGATAASYTRSSLQLSHAGFYRALVRNSCGAGAAASGSAQLTVNATAHIVDAPDDAAVCLGGNVQFTATGAGFGTLTYQWEVSNNGGSSYSSVANSTLYSGVTTTALTIRGATATLNNYRYRLRVTGGCGNSPSGGALLTVNSIPSPPSVPNVARCGTGSLSSTASSSAASPIFQWFTNATDALPVFTGATYTVSNLAATTPFYVTVVSAGCESGKSAMTFTRHATQDVAMGGPLTLCNGQGPYNLENDIQSAVARGSNFTWTANSTNFTSKSFDPAVGAGSYMVNYVPPTPAQAVPNCFLPTNRAITVVSSVSGDGGITFTHPSIYNNSVMNMCIGDSPIDLASLPSAPGGSWNVISGTGLSYSANAVIFTPNQGSFTSVSPNVFRYTLQINGCVASKDLSVYVKDNQNVPVISGIPGLVCPGQELTLSASVLSPGSFSFKWFRAGENTPFATSTTLAFKVIRQESLQVRSINSSFGCLSEAKVVDINTPFSSGTITVDKRNVNTGNFVAFSTDASESGNTFAWNFGDGSTSTERNPTHYFYQPGTFKITLNINSNLGCAQTIPYDAITVLGDPINVVTGDQTVKAGVFVFPNPVTDRLSVQSEEPVLAVFLSDFMGHPVSAERSGDDRQFSLDAAALTPGVYVLQLMTKSKTIQFKVLKR